MKKFLIPISLLLFRSEVVSLCVVAVLLFCGLAWIISEAAKGGAY